jgi:hypothetical protein
MIFIRKKELQIELSTINVNVHEKCLIFNHGFEIQNNVLYNFNDYNLLLNKCKSYVTDKTLNEIKEYLINNCEIIKNLENQQGQLSLF